MENELNSKMKKWFPAETKSLAEKEKDEEYVFEIGITLAGAISGGAYAAGVFDFLFEALDAWYIEKLKAKNEGRTDVPQHDVCIKVLTGASAGSINGLVMALVARREFSHGKNSPFYKIWVDDIDISKLTALDDLSCGEPESLLNSNALDEIATEMQKEVASAKKYPLMENYEEIRKWLGDSIEMSFASTNLNGTAYKVNFRGVESEANPGVDSGDGMDPHWVYQHRELINYAIPTTSSVEIDKYPPNYFYLGEDIERPDWCTFMKSGLASSAFPVALKSRDIRRPKEHYKYMYVYLEKEEEKYYTAAPTFSDEQNDVVTFTSVDGGAMNNEPFAYAHKRLAGIHGQNPREGINAHRAVLMVDPFPERPEEKNTSNIEQSTMTPIIGNFFKLISS